MRKLYFKLRRLILVKARPYYRSMSVVLTILFFVYFINNLFYGGYIWNKANKLQNESSCQEAVNVYNYASHYYSMTKFLQENRDKYLEIPYKKALCYLEEKDYNKADAEIKQGLYQIISEYGLNSFEYAYYVRNSVVRYYITKKDLKTAYDYLKLSEYLSKKLKTDGREYVEINSLYGDFYKALGKKDAAYKYYLMAYNMLPNYNTLDLNTVIKVNHRLGDIYIRKDQAKEAVLLFTKFLDTLNKTKNASAEQLACVKWMLANAYVANGKNSIAIGYYDEAYNTISKLPAYSPVVKDIDVLRADMAKCYSSLGRFGMADYIQKQIRLNNAKKKQVK